MAALSGHQAEANGHDEAAAQYRTETIAVAAGRPKHEAGAAVNVPISVSSTFQHFTGRDYARDGSDTVAAFEAALGALEGGKALSVSSGMAAVALLVEGLPAASKIVMPLSAYSGVVMVITEQHRLGKAEVTEVDLTDTDAVIKALGSKTDLLWIESPSNPMLGVADIPALIKAGHAVGATVVVDCTFTTPLLQRPLELGADVVMHSVTKFIGGHSDLLMGALVFADPALAAKVKQRRFITGALPGTLEAFLALRGLRTLPIRVERHQQNAAEIAARLDSHPAVEVVLFPGLASHPGHKRAKAQQHGFGSMMSFMVHGGEAAAKAFCDAVQLLLHATSLGGVESLIERRAQYPVDAARGATPNLIRLSVGIEHVEDIWADLERGLKAAQAHANIRQDKKARLA